MSSSLKMAITTGNVFKFIIPHKVNRWQYLYLKCSGHRGKIFAVRYERMSNGARNTIYFNYLNVSSETWAYYNAALRKSGFYLLLPSGFVALVQ